MTENNANTYDPRALPAYDEIVGALTNPMALPTWMSRSLPLDGASVLDLGAGTGLASMSIAAAGASVVAVDASEPALEILRAKVDTEAIQIERADFRSVDLQRTFDGVVMSRDTFFTATSLEDKLGVLRVVRDHLRPGGSAYLDCTDPNEYLRWGGRTHSVTMPLGTSKVVTLTQTAHRTQQSLLSTYALQSSNEVIAFAESATWSSLAEIGLMVRLVGGLEIADVEGDYLGTPYGPDSGSMLVRLQPAVSPR